VLVNNIELEIEKLKREYESLQRRHKNEKQKNEKVIRHKPEIYAELKYDELLNHEDLEYIIEKHKEKLRLLEEEYFGQKISSAIKENESISYEQLVKLRVS